MTAHHADNDDQADEPLLRNVERFAWERHLRGLDVAALAQKGRVDGSTVKLVAYTVATYADRDGKSISVSQETLAKSTGRSVDSVRFALGVLRRRGLLRRARHGSHLGRSGRPDLHELTIPEAALSTTTLSPLRVIDAGTPGVDSSNTMSGLSEHPESTHTYQPRDQPRDQPPSPPPPGAVLRLWTEWGWDQGWKDRAWQLLCSDPETRSPSKRGVTAWFRAHAAELLQAEDKQQRERQGQRLRELEPPCPHEFPAGLAPILAPGGNQGKPRCPDCRQQGRPAVITARGPD